MAANTGKSSSVILTGQANGMPRLVTDRMSGPKQFFSNFRDFLFERQVKVRNEAYSALTDVHFGAGLTENFKEWMKGTPREARGPVKNSDMLIAWQPWHQRFWNNVRDVIAPRKLPPLNVSSKPIPVPEIWSKNERFKRVQLISILVHVAVIALIVVPFLPKLMAPSSVQATVKVTQLEFSPYLAKLPAGAKRAGGGGGGGEHNPIPASVGKLPKFSWTQFTPPRVVVPQNPKLPMTATVLGPPELHLPSPNMPNYGDPLSKLLNDSSGPGSGGGIGSGSGGGVGSGSGGGVGPGEGWGTGGGPPGAGTNGYGVPTCVYCPQPQYSDEAVKAKYQGVITLQVVVTPEGKATNIKVVKGLGVGLDEKAIEAVRGWRFKPAVGPNGQASSVTALIEVTYRLL